MEKHILSESLQECIEACENLATASAQTNDKTMFRDCLTTAIDCADAGMILKVKLSEDAQNLHRNLFKQYISFCKSCISACDKYQNQQATRALLKCKKSISDCEQYLMEQLQADEYYFISPSRQSYTQRWKHALVK